MRRFWIGLSTVSILFYIECLIWALSDPGTNADAFNIAAVLAIICSVALSKAAR